MQHQQTDCKLDRKFGVQLRTSTSRENVEYAVPWLPPFAKCGEGRGTPRIDSVDEDQRLGHPPNGEISFTGQNKDTDWLQYDFRFRQYDPRQGRWISPDPAGLAAADPTNPQSWNRYAYALNDP